MKNIKNILVIFSLLAAPVAFGCPEHDAMNMRSAEEMQMNAPRSMGPTARSGYGTSMRDSGATSMSGQSMDQNEAYDADSGMDDDSDF